MDATLPVEEACEVCQFRDLRDGFTLLERLSLNLANQLGLGGRY